VISSRGLIKEQRSAGKRPAGSLPNESFCYKPFQALFKFSGLESGEQATRRLPRAQQPFWNESLFLFKFAVDTALTREINLNLKPARLSPRLRVSPSLRLGTRQTLPL